ncbi:MAG: hypothetical protein KJO42_14975 [Silicimonas sp.]|nr:hypothetical protein [Silicimonas sp.]NNF92464.1 hypothetical protein [Boseongicola sp.]RZW12376.1 MAG: hypothetical protein EX266_01725 [Paracoccaceae bacterium]MBT8425893.1 hypothetical protein [Silicimonas sp.]NND18372.1 hypothetical protein [Silicimonas sp.]
MTNPMRVRSTQDEVDRIVDTLLANPGHAEDIKSQLRRRLREDPVVRVVAANYSTPSIRDEVEDMWDNVPV